MANWPIDEAERRDVICESLGKMLVDCNSVYHIEGLDSVVDDVVSKTFDDILDPRAILDDMRVTKSDAEIALMKYAADLAALAHIEAMRECRPCLLYTSPSPRDKRQSRMPSSA